MNLSELKSLVMHQTNNDVDDLGDFLPYLTGYLNEAYDRLMVVFRGAHVSEDSEYAPLAHDKSVPELPDWAHRVIADWATWLIYRNGNPQKQNRGFQFRNSFLEMESRLAGMTDAEKGLLNADGTSQRARPLQHFKNIPW